MDVVIINNRGVELEFDNRAIIENIDRITNRIFKLLPSREEGGDWKTLLQNLILEIAGMNALWIDQVELFPLLCKMESLLMLDQREDFLSFRKLVFECLTLMSDIKKCLVD